MKKIITTVICFIIVLIPVFAQKEIDGLIRAEKNFAAYSVSHSTKEAFLEYIDSNSIMFDTSRAVKAIDFWSKREKRPGVLNWWPQYAEISASGDFGYTTGPWTFQPTVNDTVVARGRYITVWQLSKEGEWKFLVDLGVDDTPADSIKEVVKIDAAKQSEDTEAITHIYPLVAAENNFQVLLERSKSKAYNRYLSEKSILNRNGVAAAITSDEQQVVIDSTPAGVQYKMDGWGVSALPDMGYTYGTATINGKPENYLRIWRREAGGWKIALEVLRY